MKASGWKMSGNLTPVTVRERSKMARQQEEFEDWEGPDVGEILERERRSSGKADEGAMEMDQRHGYHWEDRRGDRRHEVQMGL